MEVLGHTVSERLEAKTDFGELLQDAASVMFSRQDEARCLDLDLFEETELFENSPDVCPVVSDSTGQPDNALLHCKFQKILYL